MTKHTPKPWHIANDHFIVDANGVVVPIAAVPLLFDDDAPEPLANSAFIVRACNAHDDLLEALKQSRFKLYGTMESNDDLDWIDGVIAKAESDATASSSQRYETAPSPAPR